MSDGSSFDAKVAALSLLCEAYSKLVAEETALAVQSTAKLAPAETEEFEPAFTNAR